MGQGTVAVAKKILKDKGSLKLSVRDFLYTNQVHGYINFQETDATFHNRRDSRMVAMTFTWNFGKPLKGMSNGGHRNGGAGEEESRVKSGGTGIKGGPDRMRGRANWASPRICLFLEHNSTLCHPLISSAR